MAVRGLLERFADRVARAASSNGHFTLALAIIGSWAVCGPYFDYSDTWQLFINTGTTIATYLIAILVANSQARQARRQDQQDKYILHLIEAVRDGLVASRELASRAAGGGVASPEPPPQD